MGFVASANGSWLMSEKEREPITKLTLTQIKRILARCRETGVILYSVKYDPTMGITVNTYKDKTKEKKHETE